MDSQTIAVSVNRSRVGKMPTDAPKEAWARYNGLFQPTTLAIPALVAEIQKGYAFTCALKGYRRRENFVSAQHTGTDFDTEDVYSSLDVLLRDSFIARYANFAYTTAHHTPDKPRARVVFIYDQAITDAALYVELQEALLARFKLTDAHCKDAARIWYGAPSCDVRFVGHVLPVSVLLPHAAVSVPAVPVAARKNGKHAPAPPPPGRIYEGGRNAALTSLAGTMRRRNMSTDAIGAGLRAENAARCDPPLPDTEIDDIVQSSGRWSPAHDYARTQTAPPETGETTATAPVTTTPEPRKIQRSTCTDSGNSERFAAQHAEHARYVPAWGWLVFDGKRWRRDDSNRVIALARQTARSIYGEAERATSDDASKSLAAWAHQSLSMARLDAMVRGATDALRSDEADFDRDPMLINVGNGILDLRTRVLSPHRPDAYMTHLAGANYMPEATCPKWKAFLSRILADDQDMLDYLQRAAGLTLTGDVGERCFHLLHGAGANGKTTFIEPLQAMMGDYAGRLKIDALLLKRDGAIPNDIAGLVGKRMVIASELPAERRLDESLVKDITGCDTLSARFLHQEFFEFRPQFKLWLFGNSKPVIRGVDPAIWSRVRLCPFDVTIPEEDRDTHLAEKLRGELDGILTWAVEGCAAWQAGGLKPPAKVNSATKDYEQEQDVVAAFIAERCTLKGTPTTPKGELYAAFTQWAGSTACSKVEFGRRLLAKGINDGARENDGGRTWRGIGLLSSQLPLASDN